MREVQDKMRAAALFAMAASMGVLSLPAMSADRGGPDEHYVPPVEPRPLPKGTDALSVEIAEHNAEVDRKRAEKRARRS